jgi:hypothetical protein
MFETIEEDERKSAEKGTFYVKAGLFVAAIVVLAAIIYFFAFVPYGAGH